MRHIRTFEDCQAAIREIHDFLDTWKTKDLDFKQRRIKNAAPSRDLYDYVVRKEIEDVIKEVKTEITRAPVAGRLYSIVFMNDGLPSPIHPSSSGYSIQRNSTLLRVSFLSVGPISSSTTFVANLILNNVDYILTDPISINNSYTPFTTLYFTDLEITAFTTGDIITIDVIEAVSIGKLSIQLLFREV